MLALERLDNMSAMLEWVVCAYDIIPNRDDATRPMCMARFDDYPYEVLLDRTREKRLSIRS